MDIVEDPAESFRLFVSRTEPRLLHVLVAVFGQQRGREATAEALAYGWEHWDRVASMDNPVEYPYRLGRQVDRRTEFGQVVSCSPTRGRVRRLWLI